MTRADSAVVASGLTKAFPRPGAGLSRQDGPRVLDGVSFTVRFGEVFGILGPNGAGKTTLLEILATLIEPTAGRASVCGHDVVRNAASVRRCIGYSGASGHAFYPRLTGARNLEFFATFDDLPRRDAQARARELLVDVGLADAAERLVQTYSDGMKQRLSLARALAPDPAVLILDEPTRSLDAEFRAAFHRLVRRRVEDRPGRAVVLVTHLSSEAASICDTACLLERGAVAALGPVQEVLRVWTGRRQPVGPPTAT